MREGDGGVKEDDEVVGIDRRHTMISPMVFRRHWERGGEIPLLLLLAWPPTTREKLIHGVLSVGECRCQNRRISGRGSRTVRLGGW